MDYAVELLWKMRQRGINCNVHTYSCLMNVCIKNNDLDMALNVFQKLQVIPAAVILQYLNTCCHNTASDTHDTSFTSLVCEESLQGSLCMCTAMQERSD